MIYRCDCAELLAAVKAYRYWRDNQPDRWEAPLLQRMWDAADLLDGKEPEGAGKEVSG